MEKKAWVIAVDMGYGHQRAAYPLKDMAYGDIINANSDKMIMVVIVFITICLNIYSIMFRYQNFLLVFREYTYAPDPYLLVLMLLCRQA